MASSRSSVNPASRIQRLLGDQIQVPLRAVVPPTTSWDSRTITDKPRRRAVIAPVSPAAPLPITTKSASKISSLSTTSWAFPALDNFQAPQIPLN